MRWSPPASKPAKPRISPLAIACAMIWPQWAWRLWTDRREAHGAEKRGRSGCLVGLAGRALTRETCTAWRLPCTVEQRASVRRVHFLCAGSPGAVIDEEPLVRFMISVSDTDGETSIREIVEAPYDGEGANRYEWHTPHAVLHARYSGAGEEYRAAEDQGFLRIWAGANGRIFSITPDLEYPGGEKRNLTVRYGSCARAQTS